jgi:quinol monooxygenase YgiN
MADVTVGLLVRIEALAGKETEVEDFLKSALPLAMDEPRTAAWFAIRIGPSTFGVFDVFPDEGGRDAHLNGQIAAALMSGVGKLIEEPTIEKVDVLASKLGNDVEIPVG